MIFRPLTVVAAVSVLLLTSARASAAPPWIYRSLTLPRGAVALDLGLGYGRIPADPNAIDGFGMNLEIAGGVTHELELGFRTGFRFDDGGQITQADRYGRLFDTETYGIGSDRMANPEIRMRWLMARGSAAQLGLEVRAFLPFENGTRFGLMFGLPIALRAGAVRIDTGLYVPLIFTEPETTTIVSVPVHLWIQASSSLWLGPLFGLRVVNGPGSGSFNQYPLGFGLGTMLAYNVDLRTWFLFPNIDGNQAARTFGAGVALQIRFE